MYLPFWIYTSALYLPREISLRGGALTRIVILSLIEFLHLIRRTHWNWNRQTEIEMSEIIGWKHTIS
jgi:hypothetical protein